MENMSHPADELNDRYAIQAPRDLTPIKQLALASVYPFVREVGSVLRLLAALALVLSPVGISIDAAAQGIESDISAIEQWTEREAAAPWRPKAWHSSAAASATPMAGGLLIDGHLAAGVPCESCHATSEAGSNGDHPAVPAASFNTMCVACHGTMLKAPEGEEMSVPNPHASPHLAQGEVPECTECHRVHEPGEVTCNLCHRGFNFTID